MPIHTAQPADAWEILGVNSKQQLAELERVYQRDAGAQRCWRGGVTLADPARIDVRGELACGQDVSIDVNCVFEGKVTLGDGVQRRRELRAQGRDIEAGTRDCCRSATSTARASARDCRVGPYARLRPGTVLARTRTSAISSRPRTRSWARARRPTI